MNASEIVRAKLKARGVRGKDLGPALGLKHSQASHMLSGKRAISQKHYPAIARLLNTTIPALLSEGQIRDRAEGLSDEDLNVARAYANAPEHVQSGIRLLLQLPKPEEVPRPQPRAVVGERRKKKPHLPR